MYKPDALWHYSAPDLSWNSMLQITKVDVDLIMDYGLYVFIKSGIRGRFSGASFQYAKANCLDMGD